LSQEGVPVNPECRLDPTYYVSVFKKEELTQDAALVTEREKQFMSKENSTFNQEKIPLGTIMENSLPFF